MTEPQAGERDENSVLAEYQRDTTLREYDEMRHANSATNIPAPGLHNTARYQTTDTRAMARRILFLEGIIRARPQYECRHLTGCRARSPYECDMQSLGLGSQR